VVVVMTNVEPPSRDSFLGYYDCYLTSLDTISSSASVVRA